MNILKVKLTTDDGSNITHKDITFSKSPLIRPMAGELVVLKSDPSIKYLVESVTWIEDGVVEYKLRRIYEEA